MKKGNPHANWIRKWLKGLLLMAVLLFLAALVLPNFVKPRTVYSRNACLANLKQIEGAKATWALEHKKEPTDTPLPTDLYGPANYIREAPFCPQGGTYTIGRVGETPRCSYPAPDHVLKSSR